MQNKSVISEVRTKVITLSDTTMPLLRLWYSMGPQAGESPSTLVNYHTVTISPTTSSASKLLVTLKIGKGNGTDGSAGTDLSSAASTTYEFSASGVAVAAGATATATTTLGALVDALNDIPGVVAYRLNAPADYSLDTDDFASLTETDITPKPMDILYKDASEIYTTAVRIGVPEAMDSGRMKLLHVGGTVTGATSGTITISRDPTDGEGGADDEELYISETLVNTTNTDYVNENILEASVYRGPLLIEVTSSDLSVCNIIVRYVTAEW